MKPLVAVVGRPNVGKSTLFNRIVGERKAIVSDAPEVTRDRIYGSADWNGVPFQIVDTGGLVFGERETHIREHVRRQVLTALQDAAVILFVVDGKTGLTSWDEEVAEVLRPYASRVILTVNKVDNLKDEAVYDFYRLGFEDIIPISALHGYNTGDLLDEIVSRLPDEPEAEGAEERINVSLVGRPNVGKSSLVNAIIGEQRVIVHDEPGTTRDAIDTLITRNGREFLLVDTAGLRRRGKMAIGIDRYSGVRTLNAIDRSDVVVLVLDATDSVVALDTKIGGFIDEAKKACVIAVSKWDLMEKEAATEQRIKAEVRHRLRYLSFAPVIMVSGKTGHNVSRLLARAEDVYKSYSSRIQTSAVNAVIHDAVLVNPPPSRTGRMAKIYYAAQIKSCPPTFALSVNDPELLHFSYLRYLANQLREVFDFTGTPLRFVVKKRKQKGRT